MAETSRGVAKTGKTPAEAATAALPPS